MSSSKRSRAKGPKGLRKSQKIAQPRDHDGAEDIHSQQQRAALRRVKALISDPATLPAALSDVSSAFSTIRGEFRKGRNQALASVYELAAVMRADPGCWQVFCRLQDWQKASRKPHVNRPEEALAHLIRLVHGLGNRAGQKRASTVVVALTPLWNRQTPASQIETALRKGGGTTKMAKVARAQRRAERRADGDNAAEVAPEIPAAELQNRHAEFLEMLRSANEGEEFTLIVQKRKPTGQQGMRILALSKARRR